MLRSSKTRGVSHFVFLTKGGETLTTKPGRKQHWRFGFDTKPERPLDWVLGDVDSGRSCWGQAYHLAAQTRLWNIVSDLISQYKTNIYGIKLMFS